MKTPQISSRQKLSLSPKLATALGAAVVASQADAALVRVHDVESWSLTSGPIASKTGPIYFAINLQDVLVLNHSQSSHQGTTGVRTSGNGPVASNQYRPHFVTTQWTSISNAPYWGSWSSPGLPVTTSSRLGKVEGVFKVKLASAKSGAGSFTVNASMFSTTVGSVAKGTAKGLSYGTQGGATLGSDNYIPVKFSLGSGGLYGLAQVEFNEDNDGYVELLKFWYSDNGSELKWDGSEVSEVSAIPEVGGMIPTALLLGMAALVRSRRKDPLAGSLAALAAGVGGLMARANSSEEAA